jgi:hypothetical protein
MRRYYSSDKKKREDAKRKHQAEKRLKKFNKSQKPAETENEATSNTTTSEATVSVTESQSDH